MINGCKSDNKIIIDLLATSHISLCEQSSILLGDCVKDVFVVAERTILIGLWICTTLPSNASMSLRNTFLHFLQAKTISIDFLSWWSLTSSWHYEQSNHFLQQGDLIAACTLIMCLHIWIYYLSLHIWIYYLRLLCRLYGLLVALSVMRNILIARWYNFDAVQREMAATWFVGSPLSRHLRRVVQVRRETLGRQYSMQINSELRLFLN